MIGKRPRASARLRHIPLTPAGLAKIKTKYDDARVRNKKLAENALKIAEKYPCEK